MKPRLSSIPAGSAVTRIGVGDVALLTKAGLTALSVCTAAMGAELASSHLFAGWIVVHVVVGTYLLGSGAAVVNQYIERGRDALMGRTAGRPLPAGRLAPGAALLLGSVLMGMGLVSLAITTNLLATGLAFATVAVYLLAYTPLKIRTHLSTLVGAIPGSLPPLIGWAAVRGEISLEAYILFVILFVWQIPHFLALGWLYREEYRSAGYKLLPVIDPTGQTTSRLALIYALCLIPATFLLLLVGLLPLLGMLLMLPPLYLFVRQAYRFRCDLSNESARRLFLASLLFLPVLLVCLLIGKAM